MMNTTVAHAATVAGTMVQAILEAPAQLLEITATQEATILTMQLLAAMVAG